MRVARKRQSGGPLKPPKKVRHKKSHTLVLASYDVRDDGTHVLVIPVHTRNFGNVQGPNSQVAAILRRKEQTLQRAMVGMYLTLNHPPKHFRGVRLVRLAPSGVGLDTGGIWNALKAPQDAVAEYLEIDDGPKSPASWDLDQEYSAAYGVKVELRVERQETAITRLRLERERVWNAVKMLGCDCSPGIETPCIGCQLSSEFITNERGALVEI